MKDYNSKFKSIGYEMVIENSSNTHCEYVKATDSMYKRIGITFSGDGMAVICHELIKNKKNEFVEMDSIELSPEEIDAIKTFINGTEFEASAVWDEDGQMYKKRRKNGNN